MADKISQFFAKSFNSEFRLPLSFVRSPDSGGEKLRKEMGWQRREQARSVSTFDANKPACSKLVQPIRATCFHRCDNSCDHDAHSELSKFCMRFLLNYIHLHLLI